MPAIKIHTFGLKHLTSNSPVRKALNEGDPRFFRCDRMPNPHGIWQLRPLTGKDPQVVEWLKQFPEQFQQGVCADSISFAVHNTPSDLYFCCYGGRHRSVAAAEYVAAELRAQGFTVEIDHYHL